MSKALGLPNGTIRAIIALAFSGTCLYLFVYGNVPADLMTLTAYIIGHYFGNQSALDQPKDTQLVRKPTSE